MHAASDVWRQRFCKQEWLICHFNAWSFESMTDNFRREPEPEWVDHYPENALAQLLLALPTADVYVLVDKAFHTSFAQRLQRRFHPVSLQSLYDGRYEGPGLAEIAPVLARVPDSIEQRRGFLDFALRETSGKPMLTFLHPRKPGRDPVVHLKNQMEAVDRDGKAFLIRFADTRSLDALLQVFDEAQRQRFLGNLRWWYFGRDGGLKSAGSVLDAPENPSDAPYVFSAPQMSQHDALARPDGLLRFIQTHPHIFGKLIGSPSEGHECIRSALASLSVDDDDHDAKMIRLATNALHQARLLQLTAEDGQPKDTAVQV
ncbi:DUF4123 domain-containing protein [Ralstonia pseudosolanacearum]|uniref:DUF4123 domain-containing protein n=1 Tax=Ralstonia pseudosolanacearum TaxID=1310165 RepID=UPI002675674E|nr:DUF4123 domain-containing protein [Ralstonia pseudosolanacearum]MDO3570034.1 DUF4123 domain-containing protein [Ralstonia pseudosolanacearum]